LYGVTGEVGIDLSAHEQEKYLIVRISNPYDSEVTTEAGTGFGLSSVERRLYLLFGRNDLLKKEHSDGRFSVELKIPQFQ
jgi:two-component system LytT family sensor kinase